LPARFTRLHNVETRPDDPSAPKGDTRPRVPHGAHSRSGLSAFSLDDGNPAAAIEAVQIASRHDLALGRIGFVGRYGGLYPIYVRGLAYLAVGRPAQAEAEFQRIVEHPHITLVDPMSGLARLQLARALVLSGDPVKAKKAYQDLFTLWKDADADVPVIKQARAESRQTLSAVM
jgi:hypothetical protein